MRVGRERLGVYRCAGSARLLFVLITASVTAVQGTTPTASPTATATATGVPGGRFKIDGCVVHFSGCGGSREFGTVRLGPLDRTASVYAGYFSFTGIPPGDYTLTYSPRCNPAGCTGPIHLRITDGDGYAAFGRSDCVADCSANHEVTVDEVIHCVNRALNGSAGCPLCDANEDYRIEIDDLLEGVDAMLTGCY